MKHANRLSLLAGLSMLAACSAASATAVPGQGTWETTLQARDLNGDNIADAYYDASTNLTWLADADPIKTSQYKFPYRDFPQFDPKADGRASWFLVEQWLKLGEERDPNGTLGRKSELEIDGITGWRLPKVISDTSCTPLIQGSRSCDDHVRPGSSELQNLIETTLGNSTGLTNTGPFQNLQSGPYWTGMESNISPYPHWSYNTSSDSHGTLYESDIDLAFAWVLHDGDIGTALAVPEPSVYALMLCGLAVLGTRSLRAAKQRR